MYGWGFQVGIGRQNIFQLIVVKIFKLDSNYKPTSLRSTSKNLPGKHTLCKSKDKGEWS